MYADARGKARRRIDFWPGYVDLLSTLLMVIMFVLMVFVMAQFFMGDALSGREQALERLQRQVAELSEVLALERKNNEDLRLNVAELSTELQNSVSARDELSQQLSAAARERDAMLASLGAAESRLQAVGQTQSQLEAQLTQGERAAAARDALNQRLTVVIGQRDSLASQLTEAETNLTETAAALHREESENANLATERDQLRQRLTVLGTERDQLTQKLTIIGGERDELAQHLATLQAERDRLAQNLTTLRAERDTLSQQLTAAGIDREALSTQLTEAQKKVQEAEARTAEAEVDAEEQRVMVLARLEDAYKTIDADKAKIEALLGDIATLESLRKELEEKIRSVQDTEKRTSEALTAEKAISEEAQRQVTILNGQLEALRQRLSELTAALDASEKRAQEQGVQIADLGKRLNAALASKVQELAAYRSEFFGRLKEVLRGRREIEVVGDRFVFQSEVLFPSASAELSEEGQGQLAQFAETLKEIAAKIPQDIDWVLRVDGHTDTRPISIAYASNWDLSAARAIAVVRFLEAQGIPPNRLVAAGFGEYRPLVEGTDEESLSRNRRIELKLDQR